MNCLGQVYNVKRFSVQKVEDPKSTLTFSQPGWAWKPGWACTWCRPRKKFNCFPMRLTWKEMENLNSEWYFLTFLETFLLKIFGEFLGNFVEIYSLLEEKNFHQSVTKKENEVLRPLHCGGGQNWTQIWSLWPKLHMLPCLFGLFWPSFELSFTRWQNHIMSLLRNICKSGYHWFYRLHGFYWFYTLYWFLMTKMQCLWPAFVLTNGGRSCLNPLPLILDKWRRKLSTPLPPN